MVAVIRYQRRTAVHQPFPPKPPDLSTGSDESLDSLQDLHDGRHISTDPIASIASTVEIRYDSHSARSASEKLRHNTRSTITARNPGIISKPKSKSRHKPKLSDLHMDSVSEENRDCLEAQRMIIVEQDFAYQNKSTGNSTNKSNCDVDLVDLSGTTDSHGNGGSGTGLYFAFPPPSLNTILPIHNRNSVQIPSANSIDDQVSPTTVGAVEQGTVKALSVAGAGESEHVNTKTPISFAELIKINSASEEIKLEFYPPLSISEESAKIGLSAEDIRKSAKAYSLHLYGYFLGTSMDYVAVNHHFKRVWKHFGLIDVSKCPDGFFYFKFSNEEGMTEVLEKGPWMVRNVPIFLNRWESGMCLEKKEQDTIPLWVSIHNIPLELWTATGISKLMSGIGYPRLMDRTTQERCMNKTGKMGYARVLVDAYASHNLPLSIEVEYPSFHSDTAPRIIKLAVTYQWKPQVCSHCAVFGHSFKLCKARTVSDQDFDVQNTCETRPPHTSSKGQKRTTDHPSVSKDCDKDGFTMVRNKKWMIKAQGKKQGQSHVKIQIQNVKNQKPKTPIPKPLTKPNPPSHQSSSPKAAKPNDIGTVGVNNAKASVIEKKSAQDVVQKSKEKVVSGFNFSKALQGAAKQPSKNKNATKSYSSNPVMVSNKFNALGGVGEDLQSQDFSKSDKLNPPNSSAPAQDAPMLDLDDGSEDFGITAVQKNAIIKSLQERGCVSGEIAAEWSPEEIDFFEEQCLKMKIDSNFAVEDCYPDTSGTGLFISSMLKSGSFDAYGY